jgi:glyoxylase-like metal-dependent hydrolase (beta-lactamase superfamily II)
MPIFKEHKGNGLVEKTFSDRMTMGTGADQIDLFYFGPGHTNGDAWVVFPAHRIVHAGDIFAGKSLPETLMKAHDGIKNVDTIINGHMPRQTTWAELREFAEFNRDVVTWMQGQLKAGKTPEQAAVEFKVPEKYKDYSSQVSPLFGGDAGRIQALRDEMQKQK